MKSLRESLLGSRKSKRLNEGQTDEKIFKLNNRDDDGKKIEVQISKYLDAGEEFWGGDLGDFDVIDFSIQMNGYWYSCMMKFDVAKELANYLSHPEKTSTKAWDWAVESADESASISSTGNLGDAISIRICDDNEGESEDVCLTFKECKNIAKYILSIM